MRSHHHSRGFCAGADRRDHPFVRAAITVIAVDGGARQQPFGIRAAAPPTCVTPLTKRTEEVAKMLPSGRMREAAELHHTCDDHPSPC